MFFRSIFYPVTYLFENDPDLIKFQVEAGNFISRDGSAQIKVLF